MTLVMSAEDLTVIVPAVDTRPITPAALLADGEISGLDQAGAEALADRAAEELLRYIPRHRPPWRELIEARVPGWGDYHLEVPRWPIERQPNVTINGRTIARGSYYVRERCRQVLFRRDLWERTEAFRLGIARPYDAIVGSERPDHVVGPYYAGHILPGQVIDAWQPSTDYAPGSSTAYGADRGSWLRPNATSPVWFEVTTGGTSGATPPAWPVWIAPWRKETYYDGSGGLQPDASELTFEATTPGQSGTTEPTWPTTVGEEIQDGTITWKAWPDLEVPDGSVVWTGRLAHPLPQGYTVAARDIARSLVKKDQGGDCDLENAEIRRHLWGLC